MLTIMNDLPDNVLGVCGNYKITGKDYKDVLIPAIAEKIRTYKKIRLLYYLSKSFTGFELHALVEDALAGMEHFSSWERIALVSDYEQLNAFAKFFSRMFSCEFRIFKDAELEKAKKWLAE